MRHRRISLGSWGLLIACLFPLRRTEPQGHGMFMAHGVTGEGRRTTLLFHLPHYLYSQFYHTVLINYSDCCFRGGTVTPSGETWHNSGATVQVTATPNSGYNFSGWSGDASGTANPLTITMSGRRSVTASFSAIAETVSTRPPRAGKPVVPQPQVIPIQQVAHRLISVIPLNTGLIGRWDIFRVVCVDFGLKIMDLCRLLLRQRQARCASHNAVVSAWSSGLTVTIIPLPCHVP